MLDREAHCPLERAHVGMKEPSFGLRGPFDLRCPYDELKSPGFALKEPSLGLIELLSAQVGISSA